MLVKEWIEGLNPWVRPDRVTAIEHGAKLSGHQDLYSVSRTNVKDLDELGLSHVLYFTYLKRLVYLVALCSFLAAPALYVFFNGEFFEKEIFLRLSLANFGPLYDGMEEGEDEVSSLADLATMDYTKMEVRVVKIPGLGLSMRATDLMFYLAAFDVAACWILFLFTIAFHWSSSRKVRRKREDTRTIGKYSIKFSNLPEDCSKWELVEYFDNFGTVVDMNLALPDEEIIQLSRKRDVYVSKLENAVAKVQLIRGDDPEKYLHASGRLSKFIKRTFVYKEKVQKLSSKLRHLQSARSDKGAICGFITFREEVECRRCIAQHSLKHRMQSLVEKKKRFQGKHVLHVSAAPEPDDLLRENLQYSWYSGVFRQVVVACLMFLVIFASYLLNTAYTSTIHEMSMGDMNCTVVEEVCPAAADITPDGVANLLEEIAREGTDGNSRCLDCMCMAALEQTSVISFQKYCSKFKLAIMLQTVAPYAGAFLVSILNLIISKVMCFLVRYEKHHTLHDQERYLFVGIFVTQFLNTFISVVISNMKTPGLSQMLFPKTTLGQYLFQGKYMFLFPRWYEDVGSQLVKIVLMNRLIYARGVIYNHLKWKLKSLLGRRNALTQQDLNKLHEGPEFISEAVRFGEMANLFFITVFFSSGLPVLYPVLVCALVAQYWVDKYQLLKICRKPPTQSHVLATSVSAVFPIGPILHCGFAVAAYALYPMERSSLADGAAGPYLTFLVSGIQKLYDRKAEIKYVEVLLLQRHTILFSLSLFLMILFFFISSTWRLWSFLYAKLADFVLGKVEDYGKEDGDYEADAEDNGYGVKSAPSFDIAVTSGILEGLESYAAENNPKYMLAFRKVAWIHIFQKGVSQSPLPLDLEE